MTDISKHPLLRLAYEVCQAIEACGASPELSTAVSKASDLMRGIEAEVVPGPAPDLDESRFIADPEAARIEAIREEGVRIDARLRNAQMDSLRKNIARILATLNENAEQIGGLMVAAVPLQGTSFVDGAVPSRSYVAYCTLRDSPEDLHLQACAKKIQDSCRDDVKAERAETRFLSALLAAVHK